MIRKRKLCNQEELDGLNSCKPKFAVGDRVIDIVNGANRPGIVTDVIYSSDGICYYDVDRDDKGACVGWFEEYLVKENEDEVSSVR